jgi:signal transduction histidine kinase
VVSSSEYPTQLATRASHPELTLESTLEVLPLYEHQIEISCPGEEVSKLFAEDPILPGIILIDRGKLVGMLSRRRFMEHMSRPYALELFLKRSLAVLYSFLETEVLVLPDDTPIVQAARQSLQRQSELLYEPIVVQSKSQRYGLVDVHKLLVAQSQIHELAKQLINEQTQAQLIQTEKMALLGRTIASVAHEILNPINFVSGNLDYLSNYIRDLFQVLSVYEQEVLSSAKVDAVKEETSFDFLRQDLPRLIDSLKLGSERLRGVAESLRNFSHMDESKRRFANLHDCIDNTLMILNSRIKREIQVIRHYGNLPLVSCYSGQLSQVFMNIISNAVDALSEKAAAQPSRAMSQSWHPQIELTTALCQPPTGETNASEWVSIKITDNGPGIPPEIQERIFEIFFTTKPVGKGTGLGLAISHQIVTEKHSGKLNLKSQPGVGTEFEILLPLSQRSQDEEKLRPALQEG